ncbi:MAG: lasso peptide biosynthesis B2 protein [Erythrobacter sp.]
MANALRAAAYLAAGRIALRRIKPLDVLARNRETIALAGQSSRALTAAQTARLCDDIAFFINRMAARVPWRADCLVQALAGQQWLAAAGIASEIVVGTARHADGSLASHAWLRQQDRIVLGGDIRTFQPMLTPDEDAQAGRRF